jgi:hypothetical protein
MEDRPIGAIFHREPVAASGHLPTKSAASALPIGTAGLHLPTDTLGPYAVRVKECQIQTPRAYVFGRVIKVIFDRADDVYVDVERKFAEALVRD